MKIRTWNKMGTGNLKVSAFLSLIVHFLFIALVSNLFSDAKIHLNPTRVVKVTLASSMIKEEPLPKTIPPPLPKRQIQKRENRQAFLPPVPSAERKVPIEEPKPFPMQKEEEKPLNEPMTAVSPSHTESKPKPEENPLPLKAENPIILPVHPEQLVADRLSDTGYGEPLGLGTVQGLSGGGNGDGPGKGQGRGHGIDSGEGGSTVRGKGRGGNPGDGKGIGHGGSGSGGPGKGEGILSKLFSSPGRGTAAHPSYVQNPKPLYPSEAREKGYQGEILLRVEVLSNGRVGQIELRCSSGHEVLDRSALATVKQWRFSPARRGENPIPFWVNVPIKFELQ